MLKILLLSLLTLSYGFCTCNLTYPCYREDIEGYEICNQAVKTSNAYINTLSNLARIYLDSYHYRVYTNDLKNYNMSNYCTGISSCFIENFNESCKGDNFYYDCELIKNFLPLISNYSSYLFIDNDIKNTIDKFSSGVLVIIDCNQKNHNSISIIEDYPSKINFTNNSFSNKYNLIYITIFLFLFLR